MLTTYISDPVVQIETGFGSDPAETPAIRIRRNRIRNYRFLYCRRRQLHIKVGQFGKKMYIFMLYVNFYTPCRHQISCFRRYQIVQDLVHTCECASWQHFVYFRVSVNVNKCLEDHITSSSCNVFLLVDLIKEAWRRINGEV